MEREKAVNELALRKLKELSIEERNSQLEIFFCENWEDDEEWQKLPVQIRQEFIGESLIEKPESKRYDQPLLIWIKDQLKPVTNEYLQSELKVDNIYGSPIKMESCPCCGRKTIESRGDFEICRICWWEDDGQDNEHADDVWGGPNYGVSLTQARHYYLTIGIYNPEQIDLKEIQEKAEKYPIGRIFEIEDDYVVERSKNWKGKIKTNA